MSRFIIDTQLPPRLARFLRDKSFVAYHTTNFPNGHLLNDEEIIKIAIRENRIIITKDSDFLDNFLLKGAPPKVLLLQFGNISNQNLIDYFEVEIANIVQFFENGTDFIAFDRSQISIY